jgi:hypothetical protein
VSDLECVVAVASVDGWSVVGRIADIVTIVAALIAFFGVLSAWLTRPRINVSAYSHDGNSAFVNVEHVKGSSPARNLYLAWGGLDEHGSARFGDGANPWVPTLLPGDSRSLHIFDPGSVSFGSDPSDREVRLPISKPFGIVMDISWQRPTLPWLRSRRVVVWTQTARAAGEVPKVLKERAAARAYADAMKQPEE